MTVQARVGMTAQVVAALNGDPCSQTSVVPANCESGVGTIYYWNTAAATMCGAQSGTMVKMNPFSVPCGAPEDLKQAQYCHGISSDNAVAMPRRPATEVIMPVPTLCTLPKESIGIVVPSLEGDGTLANPQSYPSPLSTAFCLPHPHGSPTVSLETQSPGSVVSSKPDSLLSFPVRSGVVGSDNPGAYLAMNNFKVGVIPTTQPLKPAPTVPSVMEPSAAAQLPHVPSGSLEDTSASEATSKVKSSRSQTKPKRELDSQELDDEMRSNLFVSGLHQHVTDKQLHELFAPFGEIQSAKVMLNINTGKSRGIAFVKFAKVGDAEKAMEALNNTSVFEETINVRVAKPNAIYRPSAPTNKTFVRNVPLSIKKAELIDHFSRYGQVVDVSIHNDTAQNPLGEKRNVVFITYTTTKSAELAAQATHTTTPFPQCEDIPLLAKVAEDSAHRVERLARRSGGRGGGDNGKASGTAGNNTVVQTHRAPSSLQPVVGKNEHIEQQTVPPYPATPVAVPGVVGSYGIGGSMGPLFAPQLLPLGAPQATGTPYVIFGSDAPQQLAMVGQANTVPAVLTQQPTVMCYFPNGQLTFASQQQVCK